MERQKGSGQNFDEGIEKARKRRLYCRQAGEPDKEAIEEVFGLSLEPDFDSEEIRTYQGTAGGRRKPLNPDMVGFFGAHDRYGADES